MTRAHLSSLALDEAAAGVTLAAPDAAHLQGCEACRESVEGLKRDGAALLSSHEGVRRKLLVIEKAESATPWWTMPAWTRWGAAFASVLVAVWLGANVLGPSRATGDGVMLKGESTVRLAGPGGETVTAVQPGAVVHLRVGGAGARCAAVFTVDEAGRVQVLWPSEGTRTAPIPAGADVPLGDAFEVTPGSFALHAFFTDNPESLASPGEALEAQAAAERDAGRSVLEAPTPSWGRSQAKAVLTVSP